MNTQQPPASEKPRRRLQVPRASPFRRGFIFASLFALTVFLFGRPFLPHPNQEEQVIRQLREMKIAHGLVDGVTPERPPPPKRRSDNPQPSSSSSD
ncbi:hypothetical protein QOT17_002626 [Balamuthia mandrillaris]